MAPSTEYHKRSHSRSEVLRFSCSLKNAGSVYYRRDRPTIWTTAFLKMTQEVFVRGPSVGYLVIKNFWIGYIQKRRLCWRRLAIRFLPYFLPS